ncbi:major outer membrane protein [Campylobacter vicugnae]|uniref:Major outer membrane protein n=1 Tax=Campylobacter vicugnae TaxID=1660076 RepID=A0A1X9T2B3_9BACT|nr:major outer membrane protein [Campylobacter sp. RM8964]ARR02664.1 major outer membrane protein [Campylobacter sp. RM8964]
MRLVKLSLAAIIAVGALTNLASAASLEEAIKNVEVTGYARYRFDSQNAKLGSFEDTDNTHRFTSDIDFKAALDDRFFGVIGFRYDSIDHSSERDNARTMVGHDDHGKDDFGQTFNVRQFYLGYTAGNTTLMAGRQVLGTFFTDDMVGTGIKVLNSDISGLTLVGMAFDNLQNDSDIGLSAFILGNAKATLDLDGEISGKLEYVTDRNLYGVAAIGSYDPVSFQLWYSALDSVAQLYAADVTLGANIGDVDLSLQAQAAGSSMWANSARAVVYDSTQVPAKYEMADLNLDDATFLAAKLGAKGFGFDGSVGYININTKDNGYSLISFEDQGGFITAGEDLLDYTFIDGDLSAYFVTAGYTFANKVRVGADYVGMRVVYNEIKNIEPSSTVDAYEAVARVDYKYSKKLNFKAWYSYINGDNETSDNQHLRFEARYNF